MRSMTARTSPMRSIFSTWPANMPMSRVRMTRLTPSARFPEMPMYDLLIRNADAILPGVGRTTCSIAVKDGRIAAILAPDSNADAAETIDATGRVAFPGAIDCHLHLGHGNS